MNITNKRSWVHKARKEGRVLGDVDQKFKLIEILREEFGIHGLTDEVVYDMEGNFRRPDVFSRAYKIAFELDGEYHGSGDEVSMSEQTRERNAFYNRQGIQCIMINKEMTEGYDRDLVIECLRLGGLKRIGN